MTGRLLTAIVLSLLGTVAAFLLAWRRPETWEKAAVRFRRLAERRRTCIVLAALAGPVIRLLLLPVAPPPEPVAHDDFVHLLAADTLLQGRLANPPHPCADHFETIYVLQRPTYASKYPLGQAAFLALGKLLTGHFWGGVWISMILFCAALTWLLYSHLPPAWAFLGGLYASLYFGVGSYWMNSYWGGAVAGAGGALVLGALGGWRRSRRLRWCLLIAVGWSVVWLTRPYESLFLGLLVAAAILRGAWRERSLRAVVPTCAVIVSVTAPAVFLSALHNRAVTGSLFEMPYQLSRRQYGVPTTFVWQAPPVQPPGLNARQLAMYRWQLDLHRRAATSLSYNAGRLETMWRFYVGWGLTVPILLAALRWRKAGIASTAAILAGAIAWAILYPTTPPHYLAPFAGGFLLLAIESCRWVAPLAVGRLLVGRFLVAAGIMWSLGVSTPTFWARGPDEQSRARLARELDARPGDDLVFVRYNPSHNVHHREWVYNQADVDSSSIVWANDLGPVANRALIQYYPGRNVWLVEPDRDAVLRPYD